MVSTISWSTKTILAMTGPNQTNTSPKRTMGVISKIAMHHFPDLNPGLARLELLVPLTTTPQTATNLHPLLYP